MPDRHLVEDRAQRKLIRPEIQLLAERLLRRHVGGRPHDLPGLREARNGRRYRANARVLWRRQLREPEVEDFHEAVATHHDVLGFEIPVHNPGRVRPRKPVGHLRRNRQQALHGQRALVQEVPKRFPLDQLHRDVGAGFRLADVVDDDDVRMVQRRGRTCLLFESPQAVGVGGDRIGQHLDRDLSAQPRVPRPIDFSHPTRAERAEDLVGAESHAGRERHGFVLTALRTRSSAKRGSSSGLS